MRVVFGDLGVRGDVLFRCWADIPVAHAATTIAVGDLDGDARADVAFSDGSTTTVLAHE